MQKKHIVIVCGVFYPTPSPTGLCVKRIIDLIKDEFDIEVICIAQSRNKDTIIFDEDYKIYNLAGGMYKLELYTRGLLKNIIYQIRRAEIKINVCGNLSWYKREIKDCLEKINNGKKIDTIISVCSPFVSHIAAKEFKARHDDVCWCAYTVDPFSTRDRIIPFGYSIEKLKKYENKILMNADRLLVSEEIYKCRKDIYQGHSSCTILPYLLNDRYESESLDILFNPDDINCVYAGRFYEDIRNPEKMLRCFSKLNNNSIKLHLYSVGCEDIVDKYANNSACIIKHEQVSHNDILKIYQNADCLILLMNTIDEFLPSKIFEYISACKPILSFGKSSGCSELNKYPFIFFVSGHDKEVIDVERYLEAVKDKKIDYAIVEDIFYKHSKKNIRSIVKSVLM